jgi:diguanylate cyclase (GGDEF)-like protein
MHAALGVLEQALFHHDQWYESLNRTLICGLAPDQRDVKEDAHRNCRFGQWLYGAGFGSLARHPGFVEIEASHQRMHHCAKDMLLASAARQPIPLESYERFVNALKQMRLEVLTTKHELEDAIYNIDPLTGAASRIGMLTKLREQQAFVQRKVHFCCLAMMDLDHFKVVNDTYGHTIGDRVMGAMARHILARLRSYDMFFRYGGEEFLICAPSADIKTGYDIVERLRQELAALPFECDGKAPFHVTVSFGLTLLDPDVPVEKSIERADKALYAAKAGGRNQVTIWMPSMSDGNVQSR